MKWSSPKEKPPLKKNHKTLKEALKMGVTNPDKYTEKPSTKPQM